MTFTDKTLVALLLQNQASNKVVNKIVTDTKKEPDVSWFDFNFTDPELEKEFPNPGYMVIKQETSPSIKFNNKLILSYEGYSEFTNEIYIVYNVYYEALHPYNLLKSDCVAKIKNKVTSSTHIYYENQELIANILKDKNKTKINLGNINFSLKNTLAPDFWSNSFQRKVGDKKEFVQLDAETGQLVKETHEIANIKDTYVDEKGDRLTRTLIQSTNNDSDDPTEDEYLTNSKYELLEFSMKEMMIIAKLTTKEQILSKKIN